MCKKFNVKICRSTAHKFILACGSCLKGLVSVSTSDNKQFPHSSLFSLFSEAVNDTSSTSDNHILNIFEHLNATIQSTFLQSLYKFNKLSSSIITEKMDPVLQEINKMPTWQDNENLLFLSSEIFNSCKIDIMTSFSIHTTKQFPIKFVDLTVQEIRKKIIITCVHIITTFQFSLQLSLTFFILRKYIYKK
jgi:hypothetical protein